MKLNPEELVVSSFQTSEREAVIAPTTGTYQPTPMTFCYWCPPKTVDCPIFTAPDTIVIAD